VRYISLKNIELVPLQIALSTLKHKTIHPKRNNWLNKEQVLLLLGQPNDTKIGVRDRFIMLFLFLTGARLNEISVTIQ
jgi:integrase